MPQNPTYYERAYFYNNKKNIKILGIFLKKFLEGVQNLK